VRVWRIRPEAPEDAPAIGALVTAAFESAAHSDGTEAEIVAGLRRAGDLTLSLVAENEAILGHIAFSPVFISDGSDHWYGLAPVSVTPDRQSQGIGAALVRHGLAELRSRAARGCVVLGDPAYYGRFGFVADPALIYPGVPDGLFQRIVLAGDAPHGTVQYARAFG
jgi:putative acetyltransferase